MTSPGMGNERVAVPPGQAAAAGQYASGSSTATSAPAHRRRRPLLPCRPPGTRRRAGHQGSGPRQLCGGGLDAHAPDAGATAYCSGTCCRLAGPPGQRGRDLLMSAGQGRAKPDRDPAPRHDGRAGSAGNPVAGDFGISPVSIA